MYGRVYRAFWRWAITSDIADPAAVDYRVVNGWTSAVQDTMAPSSVVTSWRNLRPFFSWWAKEVGDDNHPAVNPFQRADTPSAPDTLVPVVSIDDLRQLLAVSSGKTFDDRRDNAVLRVYLDCGVRLGELVGMRTTDWDRRADLLTVDGDAGPRVVAHSPATGEALARYVRVRSGHRHAELDALWLGTKGAWRTTGPRGPPKTAPTVEAGLASREHGSARRGRLHRMRAFSPECHDGPMAREQRPYPMDSDGTIGPAEMRARRRSAGYVGAVSPEILAKAVAAATGRRRRVDLRRVGADPITSGRGMNVDVVVRHDLPGGGSMIRKTMVGAVSPREVEAYRSGLLVPGRWWRPPHVYALEREGDRTWHLFLEHVGTVRRLHARQDIVRAARAVGELNGAYVRDTGLPARHPWLEREIRSQTRFANPRRATRRFRTVVDKPLVRRAKATLTALEQETAAITQAVAPLPRTLCHGDANTANLVIRGEAVVVLDWATCRIDWLGSDLATLLGLSNPVVRTDEALEADCLDAYAAGVAESAGCRPAERDVALGYRARLVAHSFRRLLVCLPPVPRGTKVTARVAPPRSAYRDLLAHTCDEADALLRAIVEA